MSEVSSTSVNSSSQNIAVAFAREYGVSVQSAEKILNFSQSKHLIRDLKKMGMNPRDFAPLKKLEMPSSEAIDRVASVLGEEPKKIEMIFSSFISDLRAEQ
jgi:hypothetical protein